jgi:hypothetical protein
MVPLLLELKQSKPGREGGESFMLHLRNLQLLNQNQAVLLQDQNRNT